MNDVNGIASIFALANCEALVDGVAKEYGVKTLVHFEFFASMPEVIAREKQLKKIMRKAKLALIERRSPQWRDLWLDIQ